jgi:hypothetical protein
MDQRPVVDVRAVAVAQALVVVILRYAPVVHTRGRNDRNRGVRQASHSGIGVRAEVLAILFSEICNGSAAHVHRDRLDRGIVQLHALLIARPEEQSEQDQRENANDPHRRAAVFHVISVVNCD